MMDTGFIIYFTCNHPCNINKMKVVVFTIAVVLYGVSGLFMASYIPSETFSLAEGYEFRAITAAALGGVALSGGKGNILRALLGAIVLGVVLLQRWLKEEQGGKQGESTRYNNIYSPGSAWRKTILFITMCVPGTEQFFSAH